MHEPILQRDLIIARAEQDAVHMLAQGLTEIANPYPSDSGAALVWKAHFQRVLLQLGGPADCESSA
jgi:hypothetical protein